MDTEEGKRDLDATSLMSRGEAELLICFIEQTLYTLSRNGEGALANIGKKHIELLKNRIFL